MCLNVCVFPLATCGKCPTNFFKSPTTNYSIIAKNPKTMKMYQWGGNLFGMYHNNYSTGVLHPSSLVVKQRWLRKFSTGLNLMVMQASWFDLVLASPPPTLDLASLALAKGMPHLWRWWRLTGWQNYQLINYLFINKWMHEWSHQLID